MAQACSIYYIRRTKLSYHKLLDSKLNHPTGIVYTQSAPTYITAECAPRPLSGEISAGRYGCAFHAFAITRTVILSARTDENTTMYRQRLSARVVHIC